CRAALSSTHSGVNYPHVLCNSSGPNSVGRLDSRAVPPGKDTWARQEVLIGARLRPLGVRLGSLCGYLHSNNELAARLALAVSDPSFKPNAIPGQGNQHTSPRLPAPRRGNACTVKTHVLS